MPRVRTVIVVVVSSVDMLAVLDNSTQSSVPRNRAELQKSANTLGASISRDVISMLKLS